MKSPYVTQKKSQNVTPRCFDEKKMITANDDQKTKTTNYYNYRVTMNAYPTTYINIIYHFGPRYQIALLLNSPCNC